MQADQRLPAGDRGLAGEGGGPGRRRRRHKTMKDRSKLLSIGLGTLAAAVVLDSAASERSGPPEQKAIHRLHEIRASCLAEVGRQRAADAGETRVAQWNNFPNFPNFPNFNNWNNWFNG